MSWSSTTYVYRFTSQFLILYYFRCSCKGCWLLVPWQVSAMALHHIRFSVLFSSDAVKYRFTSVALSLYRYRSQSICSGVLNSANIVGHKYYYYIVLLYFYCVILNHYLMHDIFQTKCINIHGVLEPKCCSPWTRFYIHYPILHSFLNWVNLVIPSCCSNGTVCMHHWDWKERLKTMLKKPCQPVIS